MTTRRLSCAALLLWGAAAWADEGTTPAEAGNARISTPTTVSRPPAEMGIPIDDPWSSPLIAAPELDSKPLPRSAESEARVVNRAAAFDLRTLAALGGVVGLIVLLAWGYRITAGLGGRLPLARVQNRGLLQVVSRLAISPRQSVCLLRVGERAVLVGVGPDGVRTLDVVSDADAAARLLGLAARVRAGSSTEEFEQVLKAEAASFLVEEDVADQKNENAERIVKIRDRLNGTLERLRAMTRHAG